MFWTFVDAVRIHSGTVHIDGPQGHHLARVLRLRPGERGIVIADRREHDVEVVAVVRDEVTARVLAERPISTEPDVAVTLWQAVLPNPDFDAVIEGGTALGIDRFVAIQAARSVARPGASRSARWQAIARSAAEQSHRGRVPGVDGPITLAHALDRELGTSRLLVLDPDAPVPLADARDGSPAYTLAVGPEGGWTEGELRLLINKGGIAVGLGPRIIRARLAAVVATAILVQQR